MRSLNGPVDVVAVGTAAHTAEPGLARIRLALLARTPRLYSIRTKLDVN